MEYIWEYIAIIIPNRIKQNYQHRKEVARLIAKERQTNHSIMDEIKK